MTFQRCVNVVSAEILVFLGKLPLCAQCTLCVQCTFVNTVQSSTLAFFAWIPFKHKSYKVGLTLVQHRNNLRIFL